MMSKLIALLVALAFLLTPLQVSASPYALQNPNSIGTVTPMKKGDKAPFAGTLFDVHAAAKILTDIEHAKEQCMISQEEMLARQNAKHDLEVANEIAAREAAEQRLKEISALKDNQIEFLSTQLEATAPKRNLAGLWVSLGVLGGVLVTIAAGYALGQVGTN
jgi:hypothetical protein